MGIFDFEITSKIVLRLLSTARHKLEIGISVQHQYSCIIAGHILRSIDYNNNKFYVYIIDDLYVMIQARVR